MRTVATPMAETIIEFAFVLCCLAAVLFMFGVWIPWVVKSLRRS